MESLKGYFQEIAGPPGLVCFKGIRKEADEGLLSGQ